MQTQATGRARPRNPPGPPARAGGLLASVRYYLNFAVDPLAFIARRFETYGDLYYAPSADSGLYVLKHPDHIQEVLVTRAQSYEKTHTAFERLSEFLGEGLLTSDGATWKRQRAMVNPAFSKKRLAGYAQVMADEATRAAGRWRAGEERDMSREMMELTLRAVSRTLFSHDAGDETDAVARAMNTFHETVGTPDLVPSWIPTPHRRDLRRAVETLDRIIYGMIAERRRGGPERAPDPPDLLQMLLAAIDEEGDGGGLNDREIRDQLVTLFLAGHETTSHALTWTLYLLSQNPAAEAKLHEELARVLGGRTPTFEDLPKLEYTEQVLEEAMRLYPPAYLLGRRAREDTEIGGYPVARGSEVVIWIYMTHHDRRWYPQPEVFRPERFSAAEEATRPKLAYLPFGSGPRACIGKVFAMVEAELVLATLAQRFRFELAPAHKVELKPRITLTPKHGMKMRIRAR